MGSQDVFEKEGATNNVYLGVLRPPQKIRPRRLNAGCNGAYEGLRSNKCLNNLFNQYLAALSTAKCEPHLGSTLLHFDEVKFKMAKKCLQDGFRPVQDGTKTAQVGWPKRCPRWLSCCPK